MIGWIRRLIGRVDTEEMKQLRVEAERRQAALRREVVRLTQIREVRRGA